MLTASWALQQTSTTTPSPRPGKDFTAVTGFYILSGRQYRQGYKQLPDTVKAVIAKRTTTGFFILEHGTVPWT
jgi:hypothetical protein